MSELTFMLVFAQDFLCDVMTSLIIMLRGFVDIVLGNRPDGCLVWADIVAILTELGGSHELRDTGLVPSQPLKEPRLQANLTIKA